MLTNNFLRKAVLGVSLLVLAGCAASTDTSRSGSVDSSGTRGGMDSANVAGAGDETSFGGRNSALQVGNQTYYFEFDKSDVRPEDIASIKVQANYLISHNNATVLLAGNTDERGSREYNIALGERRANSVSTILQANGVSSSQITTVSYGAEKPVALGHTEEDYQKNRRTDLTYQTPIRK